MKVAVVVHSKTGTTLKFATLIAEKLKKSGHGVDLVQLQTDKEVAGGTVRQNATFKITNVPDCSGYDVLIVGGPVWAFNASPVVIEFLKKLAGCSGKIVIPFVTMGFPVKGWGGKQAIHLMTKTAVAAGFTSKSGFIVQKMFNDYNKMMENYSADIASQI